MNFFSFNRILITSVLLFWACNFDAKKIKIKDNLQVEETKSRDSLIALSNSVANLFEGHIDSKASFCESFIFQEIYLESFGYEMFFFKNGKKCQTQLEDVNKERANGGDYAGYKIFAFQYNLLDPDKLKNYHEININFPTKLFCLIWNVSKWEKYDLGVQQKYDELRISEMNFMKDRLN